MKIDISEEQRMMVLRWTILQWDAADKERMRTRPDSSDERSWLEYQQEIELLQAKLR